MMTRGQVAKRLGVSVAAVRKFEGSELQPEMRDGRWLFDPDEVDGLARLRANGGGRLTTPFEDPWGTCVRANPRQRRMADDLDESQIGFGEPDNDTQRGARGEAQQSRSGQDIETLCQRLTAPGKQTLGRCAQDAQQGIGDERQRQWEEHQALSAVDDFLSELEELNPHQLRRFLRSEEAAEDLLDCLARLVDEDD